MSNVNQSVVKTLFLQGNEAIAEGAIAAGISFFAGYPITPATEIMETLAIRLPQRKGFFIQMEDELACMGAVCGASLAGAKSMTATSGPGFTLMQENLGYAAISEIPCVIVNVMRGGPSTGNPTLSSQGDVMISKWGTHGDHPVIVIAPSSVEECYTHTIEAFNYSEKYRVPVIILSDAILGHMRENIKIPEKIEVIERTLAPKGKSDYLPYGLRYSETNLVPAMSTLGLGYRFYTSGCVHDETGSPKMESYEVTRSLITRLCEKIIEDRQKIVQYDLKYHSPENRIMVLAYGSVARVADEAVKMANELNLKISFFRPITLWPSPDEAFLQAAKDIRTIIIPEMNNGQYAGEIQRILGEAKKQVEVIKINELGCEPFHPNEILKAIIEVSKND